MYQTYTSFILLSVRDIMELNHAQKFVKHLQEGSETGAIMVGEVDFVEHPVCAFVRLSEGREMGIQVRTFVQDKLKQEFLWCIARFFWRGSKSCQFSFSRGTVTRASSPRITSTTEFPLRLRCLSTLSVGGDSSPGAVHLRLLGSRLLPPRRHRTGQDHGDPALQSSQFNIHFVMFGRILEGRNRHTALVQRILITLLARTFLNLS